MLRVCCRQVDGIGRAQLSKTVYGFTDMQDLRMVLGCKAHVDQKGTLTTVSSMATPAVLCLKHT